MILLTQTGLESPKYCITSHNSMDESEQSVCHQTGSHAEGYAFASNGCCCLSYGRWFRSAGHSKTCKSNLVICQILSIFPKLFSLQSRYSGKFTPLAKTLQEDPSCQLCTMMQKLVIQETMDKIESVLKQEDLPLLTTLRQV